MLLNIVKTLSDIVSSVPGLDYRSHGRRAWCDREHSRSAEISSCLLADWICEMLQNRVMGANYTKTKFRVFAWCLVNRVCVGLAR